MWLASQWMPQSDLVMFLDAEPDVLFSRKQEVSREALERSRALYLALFETNNRYYVIDAGQPLEDVVESVLVQMRNLH
jgi:thymidylate kinase